MVDAGRKVAKSRNKDSTPAGNATPSRGRPNTPSRTRSNVTPGSTAKAVPRTPGGHLEEEVRCWFSRTTRLLNVSP